MAIKWLCTGRSEHGYKYKDAEGALQNESVISIDFTAELDEEDASGSFNELYDTKPVLTEAGVNAFVGLIPYPQGFTVLMDTRLTDFDAEGVIDVGYDVYSTTDIIVAKVGSYLSTSGEVPA